MFRISRLHEIMKGLPRGTFERIVEAHEADKHSKGFRCWDQLVAMVYAQLGGADSLRVLEAGFNSQSTHHYHLGTQAIRRSTLADANAARPAAVFAQAARDVCPGHPETALVAGQERLLEQRAMGPHLEA